MTEKRKVMVVDDTEDTVEVIKVILNAKGFEVLAFTNPKQALDALKGGARPDLLLLDMRMPDFSGPEVAELLRADEHFKDLRIVFFTASSDADMDLVQKYHALGYLFKPFEIHELVRKVEGYLAT